MIAKVLTNYQTVAGILDAAFDQTKKEFEFSSETIADNYDIDDDIVIEIRSRKDSERE